MTRRLLIGRVVLAGALLALSILTPQIMSGFYRAGAAGRLLYGIIFPALPFAILFVFALVKVEGQFVFALSTVIGATFGALVAIAFPWTLLWCSSAHYQRGGANIGAGVVLFFLPFYLPVAMFVGGWFGRALHLQFWGWKHS